MSRPHAAIHSAFDLQPPPPCEHYLCPCVHECKEQLKACDSFWFYVQTGRHIHPSMMVFQGKAGRKKSDQRFLGMGKPVQFIQSIISPSRARFKQIFNGKESQWGKHE